MVSEVARGTGTRSANMARTILFGAMKQAMRWQLIPRNPVEAVDTLKETPREMVLWSPQEVVRFLDTARPHRLYPLFYLALSTGMRRGELLGLRWRDLTGSILNVRQTLTVVENKLVLSTPKTKKGQRRVSVSVSPDVLEVLATLRALRDPSHPKTLVVYQQKGDKLEPVEVENDFIFTTATGTLLHPRNLERAWYGLQDDARAAWRKAAEETGDIATLEALEQGKLMPRVRLHDLRHLHVSLLVKKGVDARTIADRVGHARASFTLDVYTHLFDEQRTAAAVSLLDLLPKGDPSTAN